jgi:predicted SAM-dependent methyltransferase
MKLHLGCGANYIGGWVNVDLDSPLADCHADLRLPLPFPTASATLIFCEHFIEHIDRNAGLAFLTECRRVLTDGGVLRISTPDVRWLVEAYLDGNLGEWEDVGWLPQSGCQLLNEGMRLWGHQFLYDREELNSALLVAGFVHVCTAEHGASTHPGLAGLECRPWHHEIIVEAS